ncbi:MAG: GH1 family beta-glucosidase [Micromonosporaceae bacterium]
MTSPALPPGFGWGVATSAYQIEGATDEDGRGRSIWDTFTHEPGNIADDSTGDVACDHYHRYGEDVALMAELGVSAYRFSIAWPRIQPDGTGPANPRGIAFYDRLVDTLLARGIEPVASLYHWDLPQARQDEGGWPARETALRFAEYAGLMGAALGDRVRLWITLNEAAVTTVIAHLWGLHAPGAHLYDDPFPVVHHQLLGHGLAVAALRPHTGSPIAIANNYSPGWAVGPDGERVSATDADRSAAAAYDAFVNHLYTDPLLFGRYPSGLDGFSGAHQLLEESANGLVRPGDLAMIAAPVDALGVNYYNPTGIGAPSTELLPYDMRLLEGFPTTNFGWPVVPDGLRELLLRLRERYGDRLPPVYITENGAAFEDGPDAAASSSFVDDDRIAYLDAHIRAVAQAVAGGVDVRGYFVWSLMDNFEWAEGFTKRFGLVHVDFATQARTPRASFGWYRDVIRAHRG